MRYAALLALLAGCGRGVSVIGVAQPDRPPPGETAVDEPDTDVETGGVEIAYTWENEWMPDVSTCGEAGVATLTVTVDGGSPVEFPCNDASIRRYDVPLGDHEVEVWGGTALGTTWASEPLAVDVRSGGPYAVDAVLRCEEGDVADGCGGA